MALTIEEQKELEQLLAEEQQQSGNNTKSGYLGELENRSNVVESKIDERGSETFSEARDKFNKADTGFAEVIAGLNIASMPFERFEAGIANAALELQDGKGFGSAYRSSKDGFEGKRLGEIGDVYRKAGLPEWASSTIGLATTFVPVVKTINMGTKALSKITGLSKFTDKGLRAAGNMLSKGTDEAVNFIGKSLDNMYAPVNKVKVDGVELLNALDEAPEVVQKYVIKNMGKNIGITEDFSTIEDVRKIKGLVGELKPSAFGKSERGAIETIEGKAINKSYSKIKVLIQDSLKQQGLEKQGKAILEADDAFAKTLRASNYIKKAITDSTLKLPTKASNVAGKIKKGGDLSGRTAINTLLKGGKEAQNTIISAIDKLNKYNKAVAATEIGRKVFNYTILGGVAGSIGARSASNTFGNDGGQ